MCQVLWHTVKTQMTLLPLQSLCSSAESAVTSTEVNIDPGEAQRRRARGKCSFTWVSPMSRHLSKDLEEVEAGARPTSEARRSKHRKRDLSWPCMFLLTEQPEGQSGWTD